MKYVFTGKIKSAVFIVFLFLLNISAFSNSSLRDTIMDFNNNVIDFSETGLMDNVRSGEIVQLSPLDLKVGSIFIDVDGIAKKVVRIEEVGNEIIIDTIQPEIREVFEFYRIPEQTINLTIDDHLQMDSLPQGSVIIQDTRGVAVSKTVSFSKEVGNDDVSVELEARANLDITASVGAELPYVKIDNRGTWKPWKWKIKQYNGYAKGDFTYDLGLLGTLTVKAEYEKEIDIPIFALTTGPGIDIGVGLASKTSIEGSITLKNELTFNLTGNVGLTCGLEGLGPFAKPINVKTTGSTNFQVKNELSLKAEVELKEKVYLGLWVKMFGFSIVEADAGGGPYLSFEAEVKVWVEYNTATNPKFTKGWSASGSGEIGVFAEINASAFNGAVGGEVWSTKFPFVTLEASTGSPSKSILPIEQPNLISPYNL